MGREVRRRGRRRAAAAKEKNKNWFMKLKMWQRVLLCTVGVLICTFSAAAIYVAAKWGKIQTQDIEAKDLIINEEVQEKNGEINLGKGYTNIALFGVDSRDGNLGKGNRTDCIIVASLNNETKEVKMISVYRDTLLDLSDGTLQKCNAAYSYGGPTQAVNMLNLNLDLDIQKYVTVDFGAIADAIDLLGGVEIEIKEEEIQYLNKFVQETADSAGKEAHRVETAGLQLLDGVQATTYARIRSTAGGDFTRTERQRLVIEKIVEKAKNADLMTLNAIIDKVFPQVATNFTLSDILYYAQAYTEYQLSGNMGFPQDKSTDTISGLGSIVIPEDLTSNVSALHQFLYGVNDYSPSSKVNSISEKLLRGSAQVEMHRIQEIHREKVIHHPRERRRIGPIMNHSHRLLMTMSRQYRISRQIMEIVELIPEQTVEPVMEIREQIPVKPIQETAVELVKMVDNYRKTVYDKR